MQPPRAPTLPPPRRRSLLLGLRTVNHRPRHRSSRPDIPPAISPVSSSNLHLRRPSSNSIPGTDQQCPLPSRLATPLLDSNSISSRCHLGTATRQQPCLALSRSRPREQVQCPRRSAMVRVKAKIAHRSTRQSNSSNMHMHRRRRRSAGSSSGNGPGLPGRRSGGCGHRMTSSRNPRRSC